MHQLLTLGSQLPTAAGPCTIERFLGGGGQGEVYQVSVASQPPSALKWYFPQQATADQRQALQTLIRKGPPGPGFLWPLELIEAPQTPGFGYLMPLREPRFHGIVDLMKRRIEPDFRALTLAGLHLSQAFLALHAKGLCYRDISFGNVFLDPDSGAIAICDNDNVTIDGSDPGGILGTPRFIAPEVVRGEARPGTQTDLFSLAVLLFYLFHIHHPLEGRQEAEIKCFDLPAMTRLYGTDPCFIFDPADDRNRPVPGLHDNAIAHWGIYPEFLREHFTRGFTSGLRDPQARIRESEWRLALARLLDGIHYCGQCGAENFHDPAAGSAGTCWSCGQPLRLPWRLRLADALGGAPSRYPVLLNHDTRLYAHHLDPDRRYDFVTPLAEVNRHPSDPNRWGLKNLGPDKWVITGADGQLRDVEPGRSAGLVSGLRIDFGPLRGVLEG
ncbi:MAG: serine/threonine protein kinase [Chromatiaceae bacterium]|nr:MAG: serine/threonine protein kinase [Chromatiaceae bacterium]